MIIEVGMTERCGPIADCLSSPDRLYLLSEVVRYKEISHEDLISKMKQSRRIEIYRNINQQLKSLISCKLVMSKEGHKTSSYSSTYLGINLYNKINEAFEIGQEDDLE